MKMNTHNNRRDVIAQNRLALCAYFVGQRRRDPRRERLWRRRLWLNGDEPKMRIRASLEALKKRVRDRALFCEPSRELDERLRYVLVWERRRAQGCMNGVGERGELWRAYAACSTRCVG